MEKRLKWIKNGVTTERGNHRVLFAKFDTCEYYFQYRCNCWTGYQIKIFREVASLFNASAIEIKYGWNDYYNPTEDLDKVITIVDLRDIGKEIKFRKELPVPEGHRREFQYFNIKELCDK